MWPFKNGNKQTEGTDDFNEELPVSFSLSDSISKQTEKTVQFVSGTTGHSCALQLSSDTCTCHCRGRLKCQGASAAVSLATASFKAVKTFWRFKLR